MTTDRSRLWLSPRVLQKLNARVVHQGKFAKLIGTHRTTVARVLTGAMPPSRELLKKICDALDLDVRVRVVVEVWPKGESRTFGKPNTDDETLLVEEFEREMEI